MWLQVLWTPLTRLAGACRRGMLPRGPTFKSLPWRTPPRPPPRCTLGRDAVGGPIPEEAAACAARPGTGWLWPLWFPGNLVRRRRACRWLLAHSGLVWMRCHESGRVPECRAPGWRNRLVCSLEHPPGATATALLTPLLSEWVTVHLERLER